MYAGKRLWESIQGRQAEKACSNFYTVLFTWLAAYILQQTEKKINVIREREQLFSIIGSGHYFKKKVKKKYFYQFLL